MRPAKRPAAASALLALLAACSAARPPAPAPPPAPRETPRTEAPAAPATLRYARDDEARAALGLAGLGRTRFYVGPLRRAEVLGADVALSDEGSDVPMEAAVEVTGGWVFLAADGHLHAGPSFTGALARRTVEPLREVVCNPWSRGRAALVVDGALWTSDGGAPAPTARLPDRVLAAAFADERRGAAVLAGGELVHTRDGGASWSPVSLDGVAAVWVGFDGDHLTVETSGGAVTLAPDGSTAPAPPCCDASRRHDSRTDLLIAARVRAEAAPLRLAGGAELSLAQGTLRWSDGATTRHAWFDGPIEALVRWGDGAAASTDALHRISAQGLVTLVPGPRGAVRWTHPGEPVVFSDDGVHALVSRGCEATDDERAGDDASAICARRADGTWATLALPPPAEGRWRASAMRGDLALILPERGGYDERTPQVVQVETGAVRPLALAPADPAYALESLAWTPEGTLVGVAVAGATYELLVGREGEAPVQRPLPTGATQVAFADARRGIAFGFEADTLHRTLDGGARWEPLLVGPPADLPWADSQRRGATCDASGCTIGHRIRLTGWGPYTSPSAPAYAPLVEREADEPLALQCTIAGRAARSPWRAAQGAATVARSWGVEGHSSGGAFQWRSSGGVGAGRLDAIQGRSREVALMAAAGPAAFVVLLERTPSEGRYLARWVRASGAWSPEVAVRWPIESLVTASDGGEAAALLILATPHGRVAALYRVDAAGVASAARSWPLPPTARDPARIALARRGARWGYAALPRRGVARFWPADGGPAELTGGLWPAQVAPCGGAPDADALTATVTEPTRYTRGVDRAEDTGRVVYEVSARGVCLRSVGVAVQRSPSRSAQVRAIDGALAGDEDDAVTRRPVRCTIVPSRP